MRKLNQTGSLLLPLVIVIVLFVAAASFGGWAFMSRQDYKNNSDAKAAVAAKKATAAESVKKDAEFAIAEKSPVKSFTGPETYGSLTFNFPKTWNQYIATPSSSLQLNNYFSPNYIPDINSSALFALRVQISDTSYATMLKGFDGGAKSGSVSVSAFRAAKVPSVLGSMITGAIKGKTQGIMVLLPIRDKTIVFWTEGTDFRGDFTNTVLPSITFLP